MLKNHRYFKTENNFYNTSTSHNRYNVKIVASKQKEPRSTSKEYIFSNHVTRIEKYLKTSLTKTPTKSKYRALNDKSINHQIQVGPRLSFNSTNVIKTKGPKHFGINMLSDYSPTNRDQYLNVLK